MRSRLPRPSLSWRCPYFLLLAIATVVTIDVVYLSHVHLGWRTLVALGLVLELGVILGTRRLRDRCEVPTPRDQSSSAMPRRDSQSRQIPQRQR